MISPEAIESAIRGAVKDVAGIEGIGRDANLVFRDTGIAPADFLYIFDILSDKLRIDMSDILKTGTYKVMTISNLTEAIRKLEEASANNNPGETGEDQEMRRA